MFFYISSWNVKMWVIPDIVFILSKPQNHDYLPHRWPHRSRVQTSVICVTTPTRHLLIADLKRSDRNPFCAQMTLKLGLCIIYQTVSWLSLENCCNILCCFQTAWNISFSIISLSHSAMGQLVAILFSFTVSLSSLTPAASSLFGTVLISLFIFYLMFTPLIFSLSLPLP